MNDLPLLYTYRRCPYAMRARLALLLAGIDFDAHEIVLREKPAALLQISPKGTVPVLRLRDRVLEQSWDIMRWALEPQDPHGCWSRAQTPDLLGLLAINDGEFKRELDRYKYPERHGVADRAQPRGQALGLLLLPLEQRLSVADWLGGAAPCAIDIALFPFLRQFASVDAAAFAALPLPALQAWLARWLASPLFEVCMARLPAQQTLRFPPAASRLPFQRRFEDSARMQMESAA